MWNHSLSINLHFLQCFHTESLCHIRFIHLYVSIFTIHLPAPFPHYSVYPADYSLMTHFALLHSFTVPAFFYSVFKPRWQRQWLYGWETTSVQTAGWMLKLSTNIYVPQRMNPTDLQWSSDFYSGDTITLTFCSSERNIVVKFTFLKQTFEAPTKIHS